MAPLLAGLSPRRIAVFRALQLGDMLCAVPALRALRAAAPRAEVTLIGLPWAAAFAARFPSYVDAFLEFPGYPGLPERPAAPGEVARFLLGAQKRRFDLALQLHGNGSITNPLVALLGARRTAGWYAAPGGYRPDPATFFPYPGASREHEVRRLLHLLERLGVPPRGAALEFPVGPEDRDDLRRSSPGLRPARYLCLHAGGRSAGRWPPASFARVGNALASRGYQVVLTGVAGERETAQAVAGRMREPALDLSGRTSLGAVAALVAGARLVVSGDTGIAHLAAALGTPSVVVYTTSDPSRWGPLDRGRHRVAGGPGQTVSPSAVISEAEALLALA